LSDSRDFHEIIERQKKGSLKIYLGYAAGVGKTYSMLSEAHRLKEAGLDVVIGYVEPHERPETWDLVKGLEILPRQQLPSVQKKMEELNVAAVIKRQPQVVLIDELAHTNAAGSKNEKRYQDILEILDHQINVIATLNIQHLDSVAQKVEALTGTPVHERVPDNILQKAAQIVTVDVTIEDLRERLRLGKVYDRAKADIALTHFFTHQNLSLLRQATLREAAGDQIRRIDEELLFTGQAGAQSQECVMISMSSDPTNAAALLRKGARLASQLSSKCYATYVQTRLESPTRIDSTLQRKLQNNLKLAKTLGIEVVIIPAEDISAALVDFAQEHNIGHAVFGKSRMSPLQARLKGSVLLDFIHDSVGIDVHIVSTAGSS
jgi:two-component system, OmpR family, sensor histidine kinase KdpD